MYVKLQTIPKEIATRSSFSSPNFQSAFIFCGKSDGYLRIARTFHIDRRIPKGAFLLSDEELIAKLTEGDIHAIEAKCNTNCLCNFYSKLKTMEKQNNDYYENSITYSLILGCKFY